jgi:hypothetical protein
MAPGSTEIDRQSFWHARAAVSSRVSPVRSPRPRLPIRRSPPLSP